MNMKTTLAILSSVTLIAPVVTAQMGTDFFYSTSGTEQSASGSGGTVLKNIRRNEIIGLKQLPCPIVVEKWAPRSAFHTMAGDANADDSYWAPWMFNQIDALLVTTVPGVGAPNARSIYFSPSQPLATAVSGAPGLRPGDVGRIVRMGGMDGQVEYFIRAETIQTALGLPVSPIVVDIDAIAWGPNNGLFFSLDQDVPNCMLCGVPTTVYDGDVIGISPADYTMIGGSIAGAAFGMAMVVYSEGMMNAFVLNAQVADRFGGCVNLAADIESLEIDVTDPMTTGMISCSGGTLGVPRLLFTAETLTGGAVLSTSMGGRIHTAGCGPLGTSCLAGPTTGAQIGLQPPLGAGVASYVDALAGNTTVFQFALEAANAKLPAGTPTRIDFVAPPVGLVWLFASFAPAGPGAVAPSVSLAPVGFPDYYPMGAVPPYFMAAIPPVGGGGVSYGSYPMAGLPVPADLVFQAFTISGGALAASTPTMVEWF